MAKANKSTAPTFELNVGDIVKFVKYAEPLPKGQAPLFKKDQQGEVVAQENLGTAADPYQSYMIRNIENGEREELYYPSEITLVTAAADAKVEAKAPAKKAAAKAAAPAAEAKAAPAKAAPAKAAVPKAEAKAPAKKAVAKAEAKAVATTDEDGEELVLTDHVTTLVEGGSAIEAARDLLQGVSTSYFSLGGVLAYIQSTGAYKEVKHTVVNEETGKKSKVPYDDFFKFCATELGQEQSKVYQLIRIYRKLSAAGVDEAKFSGIGWTYAREMSKVITSDNADKLLAKAHEMSRDEFEDHVRHTYVKDGEGEVAPKIKRGRYKFSVHGDQIKTVDKVIASLTKALGTDDWGAIFHHLCVGYLQEQGATTLEQDLAYLSETHGVTVEVTGKVAKKAAAKAPAKAAAKAPAKAKVKA
jgi:hypothetical protein